MDLTSIISSLTGNNMIGEISKKFNIDNSKIIAVIKAAIPKFLAQMQRNAGTTAGASALVQALGSHAGQGMGLNIEDGMKILGKVFGNNLGSVVSGLPPKPAPPTIRSTTFWPPSHPTCWPSSARITLPPAATSAMC